MDKFSSKAYKDNEKAFKEATKALNSVVKEENAIAAQMKAQKEMDAAELKARQEQSAAIQKYTAQALSTIGSFTGNSEGSFKPLKSVVSLVSKGLSAFAGMFGPWGKAVGAAVKVAGDAANFMIDRFDKAYGEFEKISDTGVVSSFEDLQVASQATRLGYSQATDILSKHSAQLALIGGSATNGAKMFEELAVGSLGMRKEFQKLGISSKDFSNYQLTYLEMQKKTNVGRQKTVQELQRGSEDYIDELDLMAKLTGKSRDAINANMDELAKNNVAYRATTLDMSDKAKGAFDASLQFLGGKDAKGFQDALVDMVAGNMNTENVKAVNSMGTEMSAMMQNLAKGIREGKISKEDIPAQMQKLSDAAKITQKGLETQAIAYKDGMTQTKLYNENANLALGAGKDIVGLANKTKKEQERLKKETGTQNSQLAETKQALEQTSINLDQLATSSEIVTTSMDYMSAGLENVTDFIYEKLGQKMPEALKARKEESKAINAEIKAKREYEKIQKELDAVKEKKDGGVVNWLEKKNLELKLDFAQAEWLKMDKKRKDATKTATIEAAKPGATQYAKTGVDARVANLAPPAALGGTPDVAAPAAGGTSAAPAQAAGDTSSETAAHPAGPTTQDPTKTPGGPDISGKLGGSGKIEGVNPDVLGKLGSVESAVGKKLTVTSGFRKGVANHGEGKAVDLGFGSNKLSPDEINKIFKSAIDVGFTGIGAEFSAPGGAHIHLDTSHSGLVGWGSDYRSSSLPKDSPYLAQLIADRNKNKGGQPAGAHQARTGGIFKAPSSGDSIANDVTKQARTGGEFMASSSSDTAGVGKQALNTTNLTAGTEAAKNDTMSKMYDSMSTKFDKLVSLLEDSAKNNRKQLMSKLS